MTMETSNGVVRKKGALTDVKHGFPALSNGIPGFFGFHTLNTMRLAMIENPDRAKPYSNFNPSVTHQIHLSTLAARDGASDVFRLISSLPEQTG